MFTVKELSIPTFRITCYDIPFFFMLFIPLLKSIDERDFNSRKSFHLLIAKRSGGRFMVTAALAVYTSVTPTKPAMCIGNTMLINFNVLSIHIRLLNYI